MVPVLALSSFEVLVLVGIGGGVGALMLVGVLAPGTGAEQIDWRPTRSPEVEAQNEVDDVAQMLAATNERRRRKGLDDLTEDDLALRVARDQRAQREMRDRLAAEPTAGGAAADAAPEGAAGEPAWAGQETAAEIEEDAAELEALVRRKREARLARRAAERGDVEGRAVPHEEGAPGAPAPDAADEDGPRPGTAA